MKKQAFKNTDNKGRPPILLRLPIELGLPLIDEAKKRRCTIQSLILSIVAEHYQVTVESPKVGKPRKTPITIIGEKDT